jgi:MYXO-CTERM domain-containing protein
LEWNVNDTAPPAGATYKIEASDSGDCPITSTTAKKYLIAQPTATAADQSYPSTADGPVYAQAVMAGVGAACTSAVTQVYLCVQLLDASNAVLGTARAQLAVDLAKPPAPTGVSVTGSDGALEVSWSAGTDGGTGTAASYEVTVTEHGKTSGSTVSASGTSKEVEAENGKTYDVTVVALSTGGNRSDPSAVATGTPAPADDFWERYQAGGKERGGCAAGSAGGLALLGLAALRRLRRKERS